MPPGCAQYMTFDGEYGGPDYVTTPVQFSVGEAPGSAPSSSFTLGEESATLEADGAALTLVQIECSGGGSYTYPPIAAYDADLELAGWVDVLDEDYPQPGDSPRPSFKEMAVSGTTLTYVHGGIELAGDDGCAACGVPGTATMIWEWTGEGFVSTDVLLNTPAG